MTLTPPAAPPVAPVTVAVPTTIFRGSQDVQPFTYRSGMTYTELLESIRSWLYNTLVPYLNTNFQDLAGSWESNVTAIDAAVDTALAQQATANTAQIQAALTEIEQSSVTVTDPIIATALNTVGSASRTFLDDHYGAAAVTDQNIATAIENGTVTLGFTDNRYQRITWAPKPSGSDDTAALNTALSNAAGKTLWIGDGLYLVTATLMVPANTSVHLQPGATIKANATITGPLVQLGSGTQTWQNQRFEGGKLDCNNGAQSAISAPRSLNSLIRDVYWVNPTLHGIIAGDPAAGGASNELTIQNSKGDRTISAVPPAGSYGVWMRNAFDSLVENVVVVGAERSFRNDGNGNTFRDCHAYGLGNGAAQYPLACFSENGSDNEYHACYADTPKTYGFELTANTYRCRIIGGKVYNNAQGPDNVVVGVHTPLADPNDLTIIGLEIMGQTPTNRIATDYDGNVPSARLTTAANQTGVQTHNVTVANLAPRTANPAVTTSGASGAGTNPPAIVLDPDSNDRRGRLTFGTGTAPAAGIIAWVTFSRPFRKTPVITLAAKNYATTQLNPFVQSESNTSFAITAGTTPGVSQPNTTYSIEYVVTE